MECFRVPVNGAKSRYLNDDIGANLGISHNAKKEGFPRPRPFIVLSSSTNGRKARTTTLEHCALPFDLRASRIRSAQHLLPCKVASGLKSAFYSLVHLSVRSFQLTTRQRLSLSATRPLCLIW